MAPIPHQRDYRVSLIWVNHKAPMTAAGVGTYTPNFNETTTFTALTSQVLPVEGLSFFTLNQNTRRVNRQSGLRHRNIQTIWNDSHGVIPGVTLSMPATPEVIDLFLYMAMQRVTEGASGPYVKNFVFPNNTGASFAAGRYPDFEADEGAFCGLVFSSTLTGAFASDEEVMLGCVPSQLRITCSSDAHEGQLWLEADMISRYNSGRVAYTGTQTNATVESPLVYHINDLTIKSIGATAGCSLYGFGITIDTGATFVPFPGVGAGSVSCQMAINASGWVDFLFNDEGEAAYSTYRDYLRASAGASYAVSQIGFTDGAADTTVSADGELLFSFRDYPTSMAPVGNSEMRFRTELDFYDTGTPGNIVNDALTIDLANNLDRGW